MKQEEARLRKKNVTPPGAAGKFTVRVRESGDERNLQRPERAVAYEKQL